MRALLRHALVTALTVFVAILVAAPIVGCSDASEGAVQPGYAAEFAEGLPAAEDGDILANSSDPEDLEKPDELDKQGKQEAAVHEEGGTTGVQDPNAGKTWHGPWEEQVLISAAWTEEVYHAATYTTVHHPEVGHHGSRCNQCGMEITGFASQHLLDRMPLCWSYTNMYWFIDSPAWDEQVIASAAWMEYINHPAVYRTVHHDGYWE